MNNKAVKYGLYPIYADQIDYGGKYPSVIRCIIHRLLGIKSNKIDKQLTETP